MNPLFCDAITLDLGGLVYPIRIASGESETHFRLARSHSYLEFDDPRIQSQSVRKKTLQRHLAGFLLLVAGLLYQTLLWAVPTIPADLEDVVIESPVELKPFELTSHKREAFNVNSFKGKWTFLFFGYTHCPDICPTTLAELNTAADQLNVNKTTDGDHKIQYVFVSVDPRRDTIDQLAEYISYFNKDFIAITGMKEQLNELTTQLGVKFKTGDGTPTLYFVSHASAVLLIDPQARYYARFKAPHYSEELVKGFNKIRQFHQNGHATDRN